MEQYFVRFKLLGLRQVYTSGFCMRFPHCVAISYKLPWFPSIKVSFEKLQRNAKNACGNRMCNIMFLTTTFIVIVIYVHHVFVMNTVYERWSFLGEIPRFSSNKVNNKDIRHLISYRNFYFRY